MKKFLLSISTLALFALSTNAQTFTNGQDGWTQTMGNSGTSCISTAGGQGNLSYFFGYGNNQVLTAGATNGFNTTNRTFSFQTIASGTQGDAQAAPGVWGLAATFGSGPSATCDYIRGSGTAVGIDMSTEGKASVKIKSSVANTEVRLYIGHVAPNGFSFATSTYNTDGDVNTADRIDWVVTVGTTETEFCIDFATASGWSSFANRDKINAIGIDVTTAGAIVEMSEIKLGSDVTATGCTTLSNTSAQVDNSAINLFPNPSNGAVNVDLSQFSGASNVVVMNNAGQTVATYTAEGTLVIPAGTLNKGMYLVQVSNENKVATKKLVIE
jgi:hypothetical protein